MNIIKAGMRQSGTGKENREHKDSVFVNLFYDDETAKEAGCMLEDVENARKMFGI